LKFDEAITNGNDMSKDMHAIESDGFVIRLNTVIHAIKFGSFKYRF
jgi:hypothetical protein